MTRGFLSALREGVCEEACPHRSTAHERRHLRGSLASALTALRCDEAKMLNNQSRTTAVIIAESSVLARALFVRSIRDVASVGHAREAPQEPHTALSIGPKNCGSWLQRDNRSLRVEGRYPRPRLARR